MQYIQKMSGYIQIRKKIHVSYYKYTRYVKSSLKHPLESIGRHHAVTGSLQWNRYSIYFACGAILAFLLIWVCQRLDES